MEYLAFNMAVQRLVDTGYPEEIKSFKYDPIFPVRGKLRNFRFVSVAHVFYSTRLERMLVLSISFFYCMRIRNINFLYLGVVREYNFYALNKKIAAHYLTAINLLTNNV